MSNLLTSIDVLNEKIREIENNIDWLQKKNLEHQLTLDGNNERINDLSIVLNDLLGSKKLLQNKK